MWLDKPQTSKNVSASDTTLKIVGVVGADDEILSAESERFVGFLIVLYICYSSSGKQQIYEFLKV